MKIVKILLKTISAILLAILLIFGIFLLVMTLGRYRPQEIEAVDCYMSQSQNSYKPSDTLRLMSWNIGYAGLSHQMDFFYEGGKMVRPSKSILSENLQIIGGFLSSLDSVDFLLLQEIDLNAKRSWNVNQLDEFLYRMPDRNAAIALNYMVRFVPVPPNEPMGYVKAGLSSLSFAKPDTSLRYSLPASYNWPLNLFQLNRCFLKQYFTLANGKKLCLVNTHNSAFDDAAEMRKQEMELIRTLAIEEYTAGNYVIIGGDWNINPPGFAKEFVTGDAIYYIENPIDTTFMPLGWNWAADPTVPTNRMVTTPYTLGETETSVLDFFLCSPNVEILYVHAMNRLFIHSDHNPVFLKVVLK